MDKKRVWLVAFATAEAASEATKASPNQPIFGSRQECVNTSFLTNQTKPQGRGSTKGKRR